MELFAVLFEDDQQHAAAIRREHMGHHLDFLQASAAFIRAAGPLRRPDNTVAGGLWLVEAQDVAEVERLVSADPFWSAGLRKSIQVLVWNRVFADGVCLLRP